MRIVFFGTPAAAVPSLAALLAAPGVDIAAVVTNPDRPAGRGHSLTPPPVKVAAGAAGVPIWQPTKPREIVDDLRALQADACAVVAYGAILPQDVLDAGGHGFVNLHFSVLPRWRGAAPVTHALLAGDTDTGVTCFVLEAGMDTGPVLLTARTPIRPDETAGELTDRLAVLGAPLLVDSLRGLVDGTLTPLPQDDAAATYAPKVSPEDAVLDWRWPAPSLQRAVRAYQPAPGASTTLRDTRLKVHRVTVVDAGDGHPGTVVGLDRGAPVVACGEATALRLDEVQPAGKARMSGGAFSNGYRVVGEQLG